MADVAEAETFKCSCDAEYTVVKTTFKGGEARAKSYGYEEGRMYKCGACSALLGRPLVYRDFDKGDGYKVTYSTQLIPKT